MSITLADLKIYGSATMPDDDTGLNIGGAISLVKTVQFTDLSGTVQAVSSTSSDTTQTMTVSYRDGAGAIQTAALALTGVTPATNAAIMERLLKAIKDLSTAGDVGVEAQTAERTNTATAGATTTITLDAGASAVDSAYNGMVIRLTGGSGVEQIRQIIAYNGTSKVATVNRAWDVTPSATSTFRIAKGFYFEKTPSEITEVRRPFYDASADATVAKTYYEKVFMKNAQGLLTLSSSTVKEAADPSGKITFGLAATKDDAGGNGAGNSRQVAPGAITFDDADKTVPTGVLGSNEAIGVWLKLSLGGGDIAQNTSYTLRLSGTTT